LDQIEAHSFLSESDIPKFLPSSVLSIAPVWRLNEFGELVCTEANHRESPKKVSMPVSSNRKPFSARDPNMPKASSTSSIPKPDKATNINIEKIGRNALAAMANSNTNKVGLATTPAFKIFDETSTNAVSNSAKDSRPLLQSQSTKSLRLTSPVLSAQDGNTASKQQSPPLTCTFETSSRVTSSGSQTTHFADMADELLLARTKALSINAPNTKNRSLVSSVHTNTCSSVFANMENDIDVLKKVADHIDAVLEVTDSRIKVYGSSPPRPISSRRGPQKWVTRYVDYTSKYGLGFLLNDACSGVYFNDSTKTALEADGDTFQYIERRKLEDDGTSRRGETVLETYSLDDYPESLTKKVTLLQHFRNYLLEQQMKSEGDDFTGFRRSSDAFSRTELVYVKKWVRTKHAIMFFLSNKTVQVVFYDQTELLFTPDTAYLTYVDKKRSRCTFNFTDELIGSSAEIEKRLKYTKEIMVQLLSGNRP
jgi:POLO box duplicated region